MRMNFESCIIKNGGMFREIVRFFMGKKKMVTYPLVIHCIL